MRLIKKEQEKAYAQKNKIAFKNNNTSTLTKHKQEKRKENEEKKLIQKKKLLFNENEKDFQKLLFDVEKEINQIKDKEAREKALFFLEIHIAIFLLPV